MALDDDIRFLRRISTFRILGPDALRVLAISTEKIHLRAGDTLFESGEPADGAYVLQAGLLRLRRPNERAFEEPALVTPGALIGESALIVEMTPPVTAMAVEHSTLFKISRGVFLRVLESDLDAAYALREMIARRVKGALQDLDMVLPQFEQDSD